MFYIFLGERYRGDVNATTNTPRVRKKHLKIITYCKLKTHHEHFNAPTNHKNNSYCILG